MKPRKKDNKKQDKNENAAEAEKDEGEESCSFKGKINGNIDTRLCQGQVIVAVIIIEKTNMNVNRETENKDLRWCSMVMAML